MPTLHGQVIDFVADFRRVNREQLGPETTLFGDLGVDGADGWDLIQAFAHKFQVDCSTLELNRHFGPEAGPFPWTPLVWLWSWAVRQGKTPEARARPSPIRIGDLIAAATTKKWMP